MFQAEIPSRYNDIAAISSVSGRISIVVVFVFPKFPKVGEVRLPLGASTVELNHSSAILLSVSRSLMGALRKKRWPNCTDTCRLDYRFAGN